jgi:hypothetical protein
MTSEVEDSTRTMVYQRTGFGGLIGVADRPTSALVQLGLEPVTSMLSFVNVAPLPAEYQLVPLPVTVFEAEGTVIVPLT